MLWTDPDSLRDGGWHADLFCLANLLSVFGVVWNQVSDMERVMEGLQEHAAAVFEPHRARSSSAASAHASGQQSYDHIWKEIYELHQVIRRGNDE